MSSMSKFWFVLVVFLTISGVGFAQENSDTRHRHASSPAISAEQSWQLSRDPDWTVREALAKNRRVPSALLDRLAQDANVHVRIAVATNLSTKLGVFRKLAHDPDTRVRSVVARFEYVPPEILAILAQDPSTDVRLEVARNLNSNRPTLRKLSHDPQPEVANAASVGLQRLIDSNGTD